MKKYFAIPAIFAFLAIAAFAYAEVHFKESNFAEAKKQAAKEHKVIMVDLYTDWCGWCKRLDKDTYSDAAVGTYADANMVSLKINAEKGEGIELAKNGKVQGYPTIIFYNENGVEIYRQVGYQKPAEFLATLKNAVEKNTANK